MNRQALVTNSMWEETWMEELLNELSFGWLMDGCWLCTLVLEDKEEKPGLVFVSLVLL